MFRKREESGRMSATGGAEHATSTEGRASATRTIEGTPPSESRASATGGLEAVPRRDVGAVGSTGVAGTAGAGTTGRTSSVGAPPPQRSDLDRRVDDLERRLANMTVQPSTLGTGSAGRRVAEIKDVTAQRVGRAGEVVGEKAARAGAVVSEKAAQAGAALGGALQEVEIEEFRLRGNLAGHPFSLDLEDDAGERFLNFEVNLRTDQGDNIRISGRKNIGGMTLQGEVGSRGTTGGSLGEDIRPSGARDLGNVGTGGTGFGDRTTRPGGP